MVTSGKKSGFDVVMEEIGSAEKALARTLALAKKKKGHVSIKVPFLDLYLVKGAEIRKWQKIKAIRNKMMTNFVQENTDLRRRLARYEG